jgi:hypothetical protein
MDFSQVGIWVDPPLASSPHSSLFFLQFFALPVVVSVVVVTYIENLNSEPLTFSREGGIVGFFAPCMHLSCFYFTPSVVGPYGVVQL